VTPPVITIDGPAASGKSSTAAGVAQRLGWMHLDSGALYRALTLAALDTLEDGAEAWSGQRIVALAEDLPVRLVLSGQAFVPEVAGVDVSSAVRSDRVTARVSMVAAMPEVREWVNRQQRAVVRGEGGPGGGVVVDGRDIGTVVFPDAPLKIFLTASPAERARRRLTQDGRDVERGHLERETERLARRDEADATRALAPLRPAPDAVFVDTTRLSLAAQIERITALARERSLG
jgi:cytidylate kinase